MNDDKRIDFSLLDPTLDRAPFDREIGALVAASAARWRGGIARTDNDDLTGQIAGWIRPALFLAAPIAAIAALVLLMVGRASPLPVAASDWSEASAAGIPSKVAEWSHDGASSPPPLELLAEINRAGAPRGARGR